MYDQLTEEVKEKFRDLGRNTKYSQETYIFVYGSFDFIEDLNLDQVTTKEYIDLFRKYAVSKYGILTKEALEEHDIKTCSDVDKIISNLVNNRILNWELDNGDKDHLECDPFEEAINQDQISKILDEDIKHFAKNLKFEYKSKISLKKRIDIFNF